ncbi:hypothetical protein BDZ97DRAFT_1984661 [Flammula alnicola]|nr:hypothetical protein BDZ97DRAFT_1984661 [Flammula alnicola]
MYTDMHSHGAQRACDRNAQQWCRWQFLLINDLISEPGLLVHNYFDCDVEADSENIRTGNHIEHLTIDVQYYTLTDLVLCFELLPFLTHFTNGACPLGSLEEQASNRSYLPVNFRITKAASDLLTPDGCNPPRCRRLQVLNLNLTFMSGFPHLSDADLLHFIQQRMKAAETVKSEVVPLTSVTFASLNEMEMDICPFLQQYIEDGPWPIMAVSIPPGAFSSYNGLMKREKDRVFYV